jgi:hypothetical protein
LLLPVYQQQQLATAWGHQLLRLLLLAALLPVLHLLLLSLWLLVHRQGPGALDAVAVGAGGRRRLLVLLPGRRLKGRRLEAQLALAGDGVDQHEEEVEAAASSGECPASG